MRTLIADTPDATQTTVRSTIQPTIQAEALMTPKAVTITESRGARAHTVVARVLLGGVALQIFFAGLGIFNVSTFLPHMILGPIVILGSLALPIIAWRAHLPATLLHRSWLVVGLMLVQGLLIDVGRLIPFVAAFHPVNAMLLVLFVASMARITSNTRDH
jgi:hypothetical protein